MDKIKIYQWSVLENKYREVDNRWIPCLILGNGASIALEGKFNYQSLYDITLESGLSNEAKHVFDSLNTTDFEQVLLACRYASIVNDAHSIDASHIFQTYTEIQNALISAVRAIHPDTSLIKDDLISISVFLSKFKRIFSLNYDLILYWAVQESATLNDGFINGVFNFKYNYTNIYFLHGNLVLGKDIYGNEFKILAQNNGVYHQTPLLDTIINQWQNKNVIPLFISEGSSEQKLSAIRKSSYLNIAYNKLRSCCLFNNLIVFYGFNFSDNDNHILESIGRGRRHGKCIIFVSVYTEVSENLQQEFCHKVMSKIEKYLPKSEVYFYDSKSKDCWNN